MTRTADALGEPGARPLHVPRLLRAAQLVRADGRVLRGRVFLPAAADSNERPVRVAERLEEPARFFPFLPDGEGRPVLLNKDELLVLTLPAASDTEPADEEPAAPRRRVSLDCGTLRLQGELLIDTPASHSRVLDLLNRPGEFLALRNGEQRQFVRKSRIVRVSEADAVGS